VDGGTAADVDKHVAGLGATPAVAAARDTAHPRPRAAKLGKDAVGAGGALPRVSCWPMMLCGVASVPARVCRTCHATPCLRCCVARCASCGNASHAVCSVMDLRASRLHACLCVPSAPLCLRTCRCCCRVVTIVVSCPCRCAVQWTRAAGCRLCSSRTSRRSCGLATVEH
jgi:hypothetical protein